MIGEETLADMGVVLETWVRFCRHGFGFADMGCFVDMGVCAGHGSCGPLTALDSLQFGGLLEL